jgi:hypothetical protein
VTYVGENKNVYILVGKHEKRNHLECIIVGGRMVLKWILKK